MLLKKPMLSAIIVLSLALGIGLNTAIFTLINTILLGNLSFGEPNRIVAISSVPPGHPDQLEAASIPDFFAWKERAKSFEYMGAMFINAKYFGADENGAPAERIEGEDFTPEILPALGVKPLIGRFFRPDEDEIDNPAPVLVISYRLWQSRFGGDPRILDRRILINGVTTEIIGVMPPNFRVTSDTADYWAPMRINRFQFRSSGRFNNIFAKLKPGVTIEQAQAEVSSIAAQLATEFPARDSDGGKPWGIRIQPIRTALFGFMSRPLLLLQGAVIFVLLIACANVASLLLARASSRRSEIAIRLSLGASTWRIVRQLLTESTLLAIAGGLLGILFASWGVHALVAMAPPFFPRLGDISVDARVLWFTGALSILTGIAFGLGPAMRGAQAGLGESLKEGVRGGTSRGGIRSALVAIQIAMALVLLIGAGLLLRSFVNIHQLSLGCDPSNVLTFSIRMPQAQFGKPVATYKDSPLWMMSDVPAETLTRIFERTRTSPGVISAAGILTPPLTDATTVNFSIHGRAADESNPLSASYYPVTENFFATMKITLLSGRDFSANDRANTPWVAVINETMVRQFWPDEDPIGKSIKLDLAPDEQPRQIVGVVRDTPTSLLQKHQDPAIYVHFRQAPPHVIGGFANTRTQLTFVFRAAGEPLSLVPTLRRAVAEIDPNRPLVEVKTVEQYMARQIQYPRYYSWLIGLFASIATALAAVGIFGVMGYAVSQRTREIGIRLALGALRSDVVKLILRDALLLIAVGVAAGLVVAANLTRYISSQLWEIQATDPATFAVVSAILIAVALCACVVPARRAMRVDPTVALRQE